jgi:hypothetical protein
MQGSWRQLLFALYGNGEWHVRAKWWWGCGFRGVLHGNPLLGRRLQPAKCGRVSAAISSLPGKPPVSLEIRRVLMAKAIKLSDWLRHSCEKHAVSAKAQTACVPRQWLPFRPHPPPLTGPTDAASSYCNKHVSGNEVAAQSSHFRHPLFRVCQADIQGTRVYSIVVISVQVNFPVILALTENSLVYRSFMGVCMNNLPAKTAG